ncbi:hypothetical protein [Parasphingorhabdus sp.]|uniref:hypothetical protein n=1 Tax=Parasphingorhabdus sp. TaxID=2709688 RepID=UPI003A8EE09E
MAIDAESIHSTSLPQIVNNIGFTDACGAQIHARTQAIFRVAALLLTWARCFPKRAAPWRVGLLLSVALFGALRGF